MSEAEELRAIALSWSLYFPFDVFRPDLAWVSATRLFRGLFESQPGLLGGVDLRAATQLSFDFAEFVRVLPPALDGFAVVLRDNAATTLACLGLALCSLRDPPAATAAAAAAHSGDRVSPRLQPITPRFINYRPFTPMPELKASLIGKLVSVKGNVVRVCGVRPLVRRMDFSCTKCSEVITKDMPDGRFEPPSHCEAQGCKSRTFSPIRASAVTVDFQRIKLQEIIEDDILVVASTSDEDGNIDVKPSASSSTSNRRVGGDSGRVPFNVSVELVNELVDCAVPGDTIVVTGILKAMNMESFEGKGSRMKGKGRETGLLVLILEANSVENGSRFLQDSLKNEASKRNVVASEDPKSDIVSNLTLEDLQEINEVARDPKCFARLVQSICPAIFGMEYVKAGLLLGLASGNTSAASDSASGGEADGGISGGDSYIPGKPRIGVRSDSHILIVGDPGLGKSQMLRAAGAVSPRGVYVCGNTTSASGLTVTLSKDTGGDVSLEAGALVLADRGVCCIDEFDKMTTQHASLLEAMEQQSISIAKAGVICTLYARTSILAAANPVGGHYNRNKTIIENLKISAAMLSRFDLIYILLDRADERKDDHLARHIVAMHVNDRSQLSQRPTSGGRGLRFSQPMQAEETIGDESTIPFKIRLISQVAALDENENSKLISTNLLRKYIAYAKFYCKPKLSNGACKELQRFYLELREKGKMTDSIPITTRQLESMIRLTLARAKLELRQVATVQDARDIVSLMRDSLMDAYTDDAGRVDLGRSAGGMSVSKIAKAFVDQLRRAVRRRLSSLFTFDELKQEAQSVNLLSRIDCFPEFVDMLRDSCYLLKKPGGVYELASIYCGEFTSSGISSTQLSNRSAKSGKSRR